MSIDDGGPAFPTIDYTDHKPELGMSLRDFFASHAPIPDEILGEAIDQAARSTDAQALLARWCYAWADAMLAARKAGR